MIKYRDHRGSLKESLETTQEFDTLDGLKNYLAGTLNRKYYGNTKIETVKFEYARFDERCDWDTYYVSFKLNNKKDFFIVGMSDGVLDE